eukprot:1140620-Pelagomonas_calceolata.AAC.6
MPMTCDANDMSINRPPCDANDMRCQRHVHQQLTGSLWAICQIKDRTPSQLLGNLPNLHISMQTTPQVAHRQHRSASMSPIAPPPQNHLQPTCAVKDGGQHSLKARAVAGHVAHWRSAVVQDVAQQEQPAHRCLGSLALCKRSWQVAHKYIRCAQGHADCIDKFIHPQTVTCGRHGGGLSLNYTPDSQSNLVLILARGLTARVI